MGLGSKPILRATPMYINKSVEFILDRSGECGEVMQNNNGPSSGTMRANHIPGALLHSYTWGEIIMQKIQKKR